LIEGIVSLLHMSVRQEYKSATHQHMTIAFWILDIIDTSTLPHQTRFLVKQAYNRKTIAILGKNITQ